MAKSGLLILTQPLSHLKLLIPKVIEEASAVVSDTLYVCLQPMLQNQTFNPSIKPLTNTVEVNHFITEFYSSGTSVCHSLDIRVLLSHICRNPAKCIFTSYGLKKEVSIFLSDSSKVRDSWRIERECITECLRKSYKNVSSELSFHFMNMAGEEKAIDMPATDLLDTYPNVVLGGTFDRLHVGHKLLLTESCLRCDNKLTIGITDGDRNTKKVLWELMEPFSSRKKYVVNFVTDVKPSIVLEPVQIFDPFGPTITDPDLQCIVVSEETKAGGAMVNEERQKRGFTTLNMVTIDLVDDACHGADEEEKVSSSSQRKRLLGTLLKPLNKRPDIASSPYRIAVTGGIASGKSNVCSELQQLGAKIVNCDLLGHRAYEKGTAAYQAIVEEFGNHIIDDEGKIDRKKLGPIVFSDKLKLDKLNSIVWPAIRQLAEGEIEAIRSSGVDVVVMEAAVLMEAGWDDMVHEVWSTFVSRQEAITRLMSRNNLSQADAEQRIASQISNEERIAKSNVVICPMWEYEVTRKQVHKAWSLLQERKPVTVQNKL